ncbi:unnamed protein product [Urochloa decumbens]|uniref:[RNA-polymerase]-subunit kinase n=1 Tax=Urochloa decumbens TaxID=240449 RepID=A0ABC9GH39_9POAL
MHQTDGTTVVEDHNAAGPPRKRQRISIASTQDYEEISLLGAGGFGVVTKACHRTTGEAVAIKRHHHLLSAGSDDGELLLREARMLDACRGVPFLVGYHGLARDRATTGELCILMEHRGVIHRDIKPANILVGGDRRTIKICDLGLAIRTSDTPPRARAGTLAYMAPEVLLGRTDCDARAVDAWSLGCVMAELVAGQGGRPVFDGGGDEVGQLWAIYEVLDMPDGHEHDVLREMFPVETLSRQGFDVLSGLLAFDAENRLTADAALRMPWFDSVGALELPK